MSELTLQLTIIVGYLLVALLVGLVAYRVSTNVAEDYYLANRSIGTLVLLFTTFATLLSAFTFFGGRTSPTPKAPSGFSLWASWTACCLPSCGI